MSEHPYQRTASCAAGTANSADHLDSVSETDTEISEIHLANQTVKENEKPKTLSAALALAEERERKILAHFLHDDMGQLLAIIAIKVAEIKKHNMSKALKLAVDDCAEIVRQTNARLREMTLQLNPPMLDQLGFETALESIADEMQKNFQINISIENDSNPKTMDLAVSSTLLRALRELFIHAARHAHANQATVSMTQKNPDTLLVTVSHTSTGFYQTDEATSAFREKPGSLGMCERLEYLGGEIFIHSHPGHGTSIILSVPLLAPAQVAGNPIPRAPA